MSTVGATAILLLLIVALIVPNGAIMASKEQAAPDAPVTARTSDVSYKVYDVESVSYTPLNVDLSFDGPSNVVLANDGSAVAEPPLVGQGGTCISGFIIDRYHHARGSGWTVRVTPDEGESQTKLADGNGVFQFDRLPGGTYTVELEVPDGWREFTLASFQVTLSGTGDNCAHVRFKVEALACLVVTKLDAGGKAGFPNKVGIPGWEMTASNKDAGAVLTAQTDGKGKARFDNLVPGTWTVKEEAKIGWRPANGHSYEKTIKLVSPRKPGACQKLVFVNQQVHDGCIQVRKLDVTRQPQKGWKITLVRDDGTQPSISKTTDASGYATFTGLALGEWTVREKVKDWWRPVGDPEQKVNLVEPGRCETVTFTNEPLGCVDGYKINHLEQRLPGWTIIARNEATGEEFTTVTNKNGYFKFKPLTLGTWTISEVLQVGWEPVTPAEFEVQVLSPFECQHVRFKNKTDFACVDVYKKDASDGSGLPGWEITVKPAFGGTPLIGETDGTGHVRFNGLTPGTYVITEKMQDGWKAVTAKSRTVVLKATGTCRIITFKNRQTHAPSKPSRPNGKG
jgi:hypothetical protein